MTYKDPQEQAIDIRKFAVQKAVELVIDIQANPDEVFGIAIDIENFINTGQPPLTEEEAKQYNPPWMDAAQSAYKFWSDFGGSK